MAWNSESVSYDLPGISRETDEELRQRRETEAWCDRIGYSSKPPSNPARWGDGDGDKPYEPPFTVSCAVFNDPRDLSQFLKTLISEGWCPDRYPLWHPVRTDQASVECLRAFKRHASTSTSKESPNKKQRSTR